jgi:hypothetical protein
VRHPSLRSPVQSRTGLASLKISWGMMAQYEQPDNMEDRRFERRAKDLVLCARAEGAERVESSELGVFDVDLGRANRGVIEDALDGGDVKARG